MAINSGIQYINSAVTGAYAYIDNKCVAEYVDFKLPAVNRVSAEINAMGKMNIPTPLIDPMQTTITKIGVDKGLGQLIIAKKIDLVFKWTQMQYNKITNELEEVSCSANIAGFPASIPELSITQGESTNIEITIETFAYTLQVGGATVLDIDRINGKFDVNGESYSIKDKTTSGGTEGGVLQRSIDTAKTKAVNGLRGQINQQVATNVGNFDRFKTIFNG